MNGNDTPAQKTWAYDDGGRKSAGLKGTTGDCVCRAIAIAAQLPYREVYDTLNELAKTERTVRGKVGFLAATGRGSSARTGIIKRTTKLAMEHFGGVWTPTMGIGTGCKVHVLASELPAGRLVLNLSKHVAAFIDGVLHDTDDCSREGTRCVYGYWSLA